MDEMVDVVDTQNNSLGTVSKKEAHEKGLLHPCVVAMIKNSKDEWLLVKQASDRQDAGQYVAPVGGHVSSGEARDDALKREAAEEVGFDRDFELKYLGSVVYDRHVLGRHENHLFFMYEIHSDTEPRLNHESESCRYFSENELEKELKTNPQMFGHSCHFALRRFYPRFSESNI